MQSIVIGLALLVALDMLDLKSNTWAADSPYLHLRHIYTHFLSDLLRGTIILLDLKVYSDPHNLLN